jgi:hypothetical protein
MFVFFVAVKTTLSAGAPPAQPASSRVQTSDVPRDAALPVVSVSSRFL